MQTRLSAGFTHVIVGAALLGAGPAMAEPLYFQPGESTAAASRAAGLPPPTILSARPVSGQEIPAAVAPIIAAKSLPKSPVTAPIAVADSALPPARLLIATPAAPPGVTAPESTGVFAPVIEAATAPAKPPLADLNPSAGSELPSLTPLIPLPDSPPPPAAPVQAAPAKAPESGIQISTPEPITMPNLTPEQKISVPKADTPPASLPALPTATALSETGEPAPELSAESKNIISHIPGKLDKPRRKGKKELEISRAKDTKYVSKSTEPESKPEETDTVGNEAMGIKIARKAVPVNFSYELEKAYNATVSGQPDQAIQIYKTVLANDPKNPVALFGMATLYHRAGQLDAARELYGKLLLIDPHNREALNNFLVLLSDEAPQEALAQLEQLEAQSPDFSPVPAQMAAIYQKLGQTAKAGEQMLKAVALAPENLTYRYNLAIIMDKQGNTDEAIKLYRQLVEAHRRGETIPGDVTKIKDRLTYISANANRS